MGDMTTTLPLTAILPEPAEWTFTSAANTDSGFRFLPDHAIDAAIAMRQQGATNRQVLDALRLMSSVASIAEGYDTTVLNHHIRRRMVATGMTLPSRPSLPVRRFGVEIECVGIDHYAAALALENARIPAAAEGWNHVVAWDYWKCTTDGSLSSMRSCEVVSPPLTSTDEVRTVLKALSAAGARINRSCGFHVHHEVTDLTGDQMASLLWMFHDNQETMDTLVAPSRRVRSNYLGPLNRGEVSSYATTFSQLPNDEDHDAKVRWAQGRGIGGHGPSRYRHLNVHAYGCYGTIEFRQHQGTLNARKAIEWILLGRAMIHAAVRGAEVRGESMLQDLVSAGMPRRTATYWNGRAAALANA